MTQECCRDVRAKGSSFISRHRVSDRPKQVLTRVRLSPAPRLTFSGAS